MQISRKTLTVITLWNLLLWVISISIIVSLLTKKELFAEKITSHNIEIVNDDGTPVISIANKQNVANARMGGKSYPKTLSEGREHLAGMIFFNEEGDEMGGLLFNSFKMPNGRVAGIGHLSFDRFNDNQVVNLQYNENKSGVKSGLSIMDRTGDGSFKKGLDLSEEYYFNSSISEKRKSEIIDSLSLMKQNMNFGSERIFLGSQNEIPQFAMKDKEGKVRLKIFIDSTDNVKLQFFDKENKLTKEISDIN